MKLTRLFICIYFALFCGIIASAETRLPKLPDGMTDPARRAAYIMMHIWDFPENLATPEAAEQALSDFLSVADAGVAPAAEYADAVTVLVDKADKAGIDILSLAAKYTSDPAAPFFDDELYLPFVDAALASPSLLSKKTGLKERLQYDRACILKNRVGTQAASFDVRLASDKTLSVRSLFTAPLNLLLLFDPDCDHCREMLSELSASQTLSDAVAAAKVNVIAVWVDALDSPSAISVPSADRWIIASDCSGIMDNELYELPVMPSIYVIDGNGTVVGKNLLEVPAVLKALGLTE